MCVCFVVRDLQQVYDTWSSTASRNKRADCTPASQFGEEKQIAMPTDFAEAAVSRVSQSYSKRTADPRFVFQKPRSCGLDRKPVHVRCLVCSVYTLVNRLVDHRLMCVLVCVRTVSTAPCVGSTATASVSGSSTSRPRSIKSAC